MNVKYNKRIMTSYAVWMTLVTGLVIAFTLMAGYQAFPLAGAIIWLVMGLSGIAAILTGILRYKPANRGGWIALLIGNILFLSGDLCLSVISASGAPPFPSIADYIYLPIVPLLLYAIHTFIKRRSPGKSDRSSILDAAIVAMGVGSLIWIYLVMPSASSGESLWVTAFSVYYPVVNILMISFLARLMFIDFRTRVVQLLSVGFIGLLIGDTVYGMSQFYTGWSMGGLIDLSWLAMYASFGAAALHPSMTQLDSPIDKEVTAKPRRLFLLAAVSLMPPAILIFDNMQGEASNTTLTIAIISSIMFVLVAIRMYLLTREISARKAESIIEKQKTDLFYLTSHQLRTPASAVHSMLSMLLDGYIGKLTAKQSAMLENIQSENNNEINIINSLLDAAQFDLQGIKLNLAATNIGDLAESVVKEQRPAASAKKQKIVLNSGKDSIVSADGEKIKMVVSSILANAIQYTQEGGMIRLSVDNAKDGVEIVVADNGAGISPKVLPNLFKKFAKASDEAAISTAGMGLSLYIAKCLIDNHGGRIDVSSVVGKGSEFTVRLPRNNKE